MNKMSDWVPWADVTEIIPAHVPKRMDRLNKYYLQMEVRNFAKVKDYHGIMIAETPGSRKVSFLVAVLKVYSRQGGIPDEEERDDLDDRYQHKRECEAQAIRDINRIL